MTKRILIVSIVMLVILFALSLYLQVEAVSSSSLLHLMPVIYNPPEPTATITPTPTRTPRPTVEPTATPTPVYEDPSTYDWVYIGIAQLSKDKQSVNVLGKNPGACYVVEIDQETEDGMVLLKSRELVSGTYPCSVPPYNPEAVWPPVQFPPPPDPLPADWDWFLYGEVYSFVIPKSAKIVCGAGESIFGTTNCYKVIRPGD